MTIATPAKLRNGSWGARVEGSVQEGMRVEIRTKGGKSWTAVVDRIIWQGDGVALCATTSIRQHATWTGCWCGSIEEYERPNDCEQCRFDR